MRGRRRCVDGIPQEQSAVVGANIRALRLRNRWTQTKLGELMGWPTNATVCAAEGHRAGRQRDLTANEQSHVAELKPAMPVAELEASSQGRNAAHCPGRPLQCSKAPTLEHWRPPLPDGPDGKSQA
jgi:hypothetical protein